MDTIILAITDFADKMGTVQSGITGILGALLAIALLMLLFSRFGGK